MLDILTQIHYRLKEIYANFPHFNKANPLDELLFILCSVKTAEFRYLASFKFLKTQFPTFAQLYTAPERSIASTLAGAGLQHQKARKIKAILNSIVARYRKPTLSPLRDLSDQECEEFLTSLPGVGKKVARCVMMYSLGRQVFPVDTHCWRICRRLGWVRPTAKDGHPTGRDMDRLQAKIPPELRFSLHVNMVSLGREFCTARDPDCGGCPITDLCPKVGVKSKGV